jgi:uroporphyrin-III C-methyltransferase / precorrin-2 dehydrogenase / sirohydrochlorin ferrochelatase
MKQLPVFITVKDRNVILVGDGDAADAKRRLIERAGGRVVTPDADDAVIAFVAVEDAVEAEMVSELLKQRGLLVNVVDQPALCDFTTPAIIDRDPMLIAIGTGGASAGLAKAVRQRLEQILPQSLGTLARALESARGAIRSKWPENSERRKAIDAALGEGARLDPLAHQSDRAVTDWLKDSIFTQSDGFIHMVLSSDDPDDLTLGQARILGQADHIFYTGSVPDVILNRARADATRTLGAVPESPPSGFVVQLVGFEQNSASEPML